MSGSEVPLVILTSPLGDCLCETTIDVENNDVTKVSHQEPRLQSHQVNAEISADQETEETEPEADATTRLTKDEGVSEEEHHTPLTSGVEKPPPSYNSIFTTGNDEHQSHQNQQQQNGETRRKLSRLSLPSARTTLRRLSDTWRDFSPRSSLTSIWPDSPSSATTLTGFIIRDKHADFETQTRQVLRLASVLLSCGITILILESLTSVYTSASWVAGYSRCGISAGVLIAITGVLGILFATRKDSPQKCLNFFKGFCLLSLLTGLVILCSTLASLDIRWINYTEVRASIFEVVLTSVKVVVTAVTITASLASIYV